MLKRGTGLPVLIPFVGEGNCEPLIGGECNWLGCMVGGANLGPEGGVKGEGLGFVSGLRDCGSGVDGVIPTEYPAGKLGWSAINAHI